VPRGERGTSRGQRGIYAIKSALIQTSSRAFYDWLLSWPHSNFQAVIIGTGGHAHPLVTSGFATVTRYAPTQCPVCVSPLPITPFSGTTRESRGLRLRDQNLPLHRPHPSALRSDVDTTLYPDRHRSRLGNKSKWRTYSTARRKSSPKLKGTRAWIVVPCWGRDSMENVPFSIFSRSSMLMRPSPRLAFAA